MGSKPVITLPEEHFVRSPYSEVLYVLQEAEQLGEEKRKLKPKEIRETFKNIKARGRLFFELVQETELNREEMIQVRVEDINLDKGGIRLRSEAEDEEETYVFIQDAAILKALGEYVGSRKSGWLFSRKSVTSFSDVEDISPARLSQVLRQLRHYGLVEKESGRYYMSDKYISDFRRDYLCERLFEHEKGEVNWSEQGWWLSGAVLDDSETANEVRKELNSLASSFVGRPVMRRIDEVNRRMKMEEIADHLLRILTTKELDQEKKGYVIHYIRSEIGDHLQVRFINEMSEKEEAQYKDSERIRDDISRRVESILREWDTIVDRKAGGIEEFSEISRISKEYYEGKKPMFDDEFLEWLYFEAFSGKDFIFRGYPLLVLGNFNETAF
ncbi:MAG: hypothetical protein ACW99U_18120 [Candidatus Thorarchaeota archaeon]|jgi:hypothetical protein